jgi:uncharacterized protein
MLDPVMASPQHAAGALPGTSGLTERLKVLFFRSFFRLLLVAIGVAEWACIAWGLYALGVPPPPVLHVVGPLAILALNRRIATNRRAVRRRGPWAAWALRGYVAFAFTSVFCGLFLAAAGVLWLASWPVGVALAGMIPPGADLWAGDTFRWVVNAGMAGISGLFLYGYTIGGRAVTVSRLRVPIPGLDPALDGFRIVQLSDIHIGQYLAPDELAEHVARVNGLEPDLICLTGDLVDQAETCARGFPALAGLRARHGVFAVLGNHDVAAGAEAVTRALRQLTPFTVLRNARADLDVGGTGLTILGVDDLGRDWARGVPEHPALPGVLAGVTAGRPAILLSHRPDCFAQAARLGVSLMLSGHTHGGQLALPALLGGRPRNLAEFITSFDRGLYTSGNATLYVNRGLGFTGQRIRLFTPREIACFELRAA